ncbi:hypothetical protein AB0M29_35345 [Streptomyces sp. NPDC051976]|uniref:hypothetical protein n=1 Tax=Streptomyces sp. NPDC051976 TaxID=3154947 RepID=UPI003421CD3F
MRTLTITDLHLDFLHVAHKTTREGRLQHHRPSGAAASPQAIGRFTRARWGIEAVHHVRDTMFGEDASKIRTGHGPENMATLRSFVISSLRAAGHRRPA